MKTPAKKSTNAPGAKAAPAKKVETPAEAAKPAAAKTPAPAPADAATGGTGLSPDTTSQGQADMQGKDTSKAVPTDAATAANGVGAVIPSEKELNSPDGAGAPTPGDETTIDVEAIKQEAYRAGYSDGFSEALDGQAIPGDNPETPDKLEFSGYDLGQTESTTAFGPGYDMVQIVALAMMTPEQQRKGGLGPMVARMASYLDGLDPDDRYAAMVFMHAIGETKPMDLATGRFTRFVNEALGVLNGGGVAPLAGETAADRLAAATRFDRAFPQDPELDPTAQPEQDLSGIDLDDADSGAAAAARMAGLGRSQPHGID